MTIAVVHSATPPGRAALLAGAQEALLRLEDLVIAVAAGSDRVTVEEVREQLGPTANQLDEEGLTIGIGRSHLSDPSDAVVQVAQEDDARLLVLGPRRRTPVGKLIMGSLAQRILLEATCPVLAVKACPGHIAPARPKSRASSAAGSEKGPPHSGGGPSHSWRLRWVTRIHGRGSGGLPPSAAPCPVTVVFP